MYEAGDVQIVPQPAPSRLHSSVAASDAWKVKPAFADVEGCAGPESIVVVGAVRSNVTARVVPQLDVLPAVSADCASQ